MHLIATAKDHQRERAFCRGIIQEIIMSTEDHVRTELQLHGAVTAHELVREIDRVLAVRHDDTLLEDMPRDGEDPDRRLPLMAKLAEKALRLSLAGPTIGEFGTAKVCSMAVIRYDFIQLRYEHGPSARGMQVGNEDAMVAAG